MLKIGITGSSGFIGTALRNYLKLDNLNFDIIRFTQKDFNDQSLLQKLVKQCDVIVHLAGINRNDNLDYLYQTNLLLTTDLIHALEATCSKPHVIFASSTQEENDSAYGRSKRDSRALWKSWSERNKALFTGLIIPNVFGPFGKPYYNSVISTFCHKLVCQEELNIEIITDKELQLIYIDDLVRIIIGIIKEKHTSNEYKFYNVNTKCVSEILELLQRFNRKYNYDGRIPRTLGTFELNLFRTFQTFFNISCIELGGNYDDRGCLTELIRSEMSGQVSYITTKHGITRGEHFHTHKLERFIIIDGDALIKLRKIGDTQVISKKISSGKPTYIDIPIWYTHNLTNIGLKDLKTIIWTNELYSKDHPDTYFEKVEL